MAFSFGEKKATGKVKIQAGTLRVRKGEKMSDDVGINLVWNTEDGRLDGTIRLINCKTTMQDESAIKSKIEDFINSIAEI